MPTLTIDNQTVTVPDGSNVLEAAKRLGIVIPHFCYHEALGAVGACRLCAMQFVDGPVKGIQMSCMVSAQDGMVVSTLDQDAAELRAHVIEWLMLNHPHDCPVCDEGGECQLQDMTIAGGHGVRQQVLELADLVAAERDAGVAVLTLGPDLHLAAQGLAEAGQRMDRGGSEQEGLAAEVVEAHRGVLGVGEAASGRQAIGGATAR